MENLRKRVDIRIVKSNETDKMRKLVASPFFSRHAIFTNDLSGINMRESKLLLNKPVYVEMTILDNSKILMYDYYYNMLKKEYGSKCELLHCTQTPTAFCLRLKQRTTTKTWKGENMTRATTRRSSHSPQTPTKRSKAK